LSRLDKPDCHERERYTVKPADRYLNYENDLQASQDGGFILMLVTASEPLVTGSISTDYVSMVNARNPNVRILN